MSEPQIILGDNLEVMRGMATGSVDLCFTSPPYEAARTYGIDFALKGQAWVDWAVERFMECYRVSKGLTAWVIEGQTRQFTYSATPMLFMADLHRRGVKLRKPPIFARVGIPGSGGPDWLRNDYEFIVCASHGKLPWSDNTACGHTPKWARGGEMSNRLSNGSRVNQWGHSIGSGATVVEEGGVVRSKGKRPSHTESPLPSIANPGNIIRINVGGGVMGSDLAHENEAPFPEKLAEFFVKSFCPPGGTVLDCHAGSGTTLAVAVKNGRKAIGIDVRKSQVDLTARRVGEVSHLFGAPA